MRAYWALIKIDLKLAFRQGTVIFFNYVFPLVFFFLFGQLLRARQGGNAYLVVSMVLVLGILGNGLFGAGMRTVQEREQNILRRFKVAPISPTPYLVASVVTGWVIYLPVILLVMILAHLLYGMPAPAHPVSFLVLVSLGVLAFRAIGLIVASVVNSAQESNVLLNILYLAMLFLSGATVPITVLPEAAQVVAQFLPASYLVSGFQSVLLRNETLLENWPAAVALAISLGMGLFVSAQLFRWDKEEKIRPAAKIWVLGVLCPFLFLGTYEVYSRDQIRKNQVLWRQLQRSQTTFIRGARIFVGDGRVIESGGVLVRGGKIAEVFEGPLPDPDKLDAGTLEAAGKTLLPGLIDVHVHLAALGGYVSETEGFSPDTAAARALASYLYCGVTAVKSVGDPLELSLKLRSDVNNGVYQGAQLFACGPLFTVPGGHGTEYFEGLPEAVRSEVERQFLRMPVSGQQARQQVVDLQQAGVDGIKAVLEAGQTGMLFERMDTALFAAISEQSQAARLPLVVHTGDVADIVDALDHGATGIEHGSFRAVVPGEVWERMAEQGVTYNPTLSVIEALTHLSAGNPKLLARTLVQQVGPRALLEGTETALARQQGADLIRRFGLLDQAPAIARENLLRAHRAGVTLVSGSDAGNPLVVHGPTVQRELQLWVDAGVPAMQALQAATWNAAKLLGAEDRIGLIVAGHDADLLIVDGNPLDDIAALERISTVFFKGEQIERSRLFQQDSWTPQP